MIRLTQMGHNDCLFQTALERSLSMKPSSKLPPVAPPTVHVCLVPPRRMELKHDMRNRDTQTSCFSCTMHKNMGY